MDGHPRPDMAHPGEGVSNREEAGLRYDAALNLLRAMECGKWLGPPTLTIAAIVSLVWHGMEWERGMRP